MTNKRKNHSTTQSITSQKAAWVITAWMAFCSLVCTIIFMILIVHILRYCVFSNRGVECSWPSQAQEQPVEEN